jgi:hypothetical protein
MVKAGETSVACGLGHEKVRGFGHALIISDEIGKTKKHNASHIMNSIDCIFVSSGGLLGRAQW